MLELLDTPALLRDPAAEVEGPVTVPETAFDWDGVLRAGTTPNGVFGAKVMWSHLADLWPRLEGRLLEDVLPRLHFLRVARADRVAQAVSLWIAIQTQHWRDEGDNATPLHFAAENEHLGIIRLLIEHGADPIGIGDYHELDVPGGHLWFLRAHDLLASELSATGG